jgi:hypothetical protein
MRDGGADTSDTADTAGGAGSLGRAEGVRSRVQKRVVGSRFPDRTTEVPSEMVTWWALYVAVSPQSQRRPMETREPENDGKT